jgi:hypothetical protein
MWLLSKQAATGDLGSWEQEMKVPSRVVGTRQGRVAHDARALIEPLAMTRTVAEIQKLFLSSPRYAVVGASKDQSKYGTKVRGMIYLCPPLAKTACSSAVIRRTL